MVIWSFVYPRVLIFERESPCYNYRIAITVFIVSNLFTVAPSGGTKLRLLLHRERLVCEFSSMRKRSFRSGQREKCGQRQVYVINVNARKQVQNWRKWTQCVLVVAALLYTWSRFPWSSPGRTPTLPSFRARMHDSRKDRTPSFNKSHLPSTLICLGKRNISAVLSNSRRDITFDSCSISSQATRFVLIPTRWFKILCNDETLREITRSKLFLRLETNSNEICTVIRGAKVEIV